AWPGLTITLTAHGFNPNEEVIYSEITPSGTAFVGPLSLPGGANAAGYIGPLPIPIREEMVQGGEGRWSVTFHGSASGHDAVIYFCLLAAAPTATPVPPTATPRPPTVTPLPPTVTPAAATVTPTETGANPTMTPAAPGVTATV